MTAEKIDSDAGRGAQGRRGLVAQPCCGVADGWRPEVHRVALLGLCVAHVCRALLERFGLLHTDLNLSNAVIWQVGATGASFATPAPRAGTHPRLRWRRRRRA